jgi:hypothetical protein
LELQKYRKKFGFVRFYALTIVVLSLVFYAGYEFANIQKNKLQAQNRLINKSLGNLTSVHEQLQSEFNVLKVELDIAQLTNESSQATIKDSINREQGLIEQVSFYQRVMAPEMTQDGFVLQTMEINPTVSERNYSIKMMLLQHENVKAVIKGSLGIRMFGSADGKPVNFPIVDLQDEPKTSLSFAFKYFQVIETNVTLPLGFTPEKFEIKTDIYKYNKKRGNYSTTIKWQEAFAEAE